MTKEILLYNPIYSYTAANFINEMEANKNNDICVRGNCPGGDVFAFNGMVAKYQEHKKGKSVQVDGMAASAFAYFLLYADKVKCLSVSKFLFHRAAMGTLNDEKTMSAEAAKICNDMNMQLRSALESKVSADRFQAISGTSYDEMFSMETRKDVILNAEQMKALGIVNEIMPLTTQLRDQITALSSSYGIAAFADSITIEKTKIMTSAEFKVANPEAYNEILTAGITAERDRVGSIMVYADVDAKKCKELIASGNALSMTDREEVMVKKLSANALANISASNADPVTPVTTGSPTVDPKIAEAKAIADYVEAAKAEIYAFKQN